MIQGGVYRLGDGGARLEIPSWAPNAELMSRPTMMHEPGVLCLYMGDEIMDRYNTTYNFHLVMVNGCLRSIRPGDLKKV